MTIESAPSALNDERDPQTELLNLETALNAAIGCGRYLVAVWRVADGQVHLYREIDGFPSDDLGAALELLRADLAPMTSSETVDEGAPRFSATA